MPVLGAANSARTGAVNSTSGAHARVDAMYFTAGTRAAVTAGAECHRPGVSKLER